MIQGYAETEYKGHRIRFGFVEGLGEWVALSDRGYYEGETPEEAVDKAKQAIDDKERKENK